MLRNRYLVVVLTSNAKKVKCNGHYQPLRYQSTVFGVLPTPSDHALGLVSVEKPVVHTSTAFFFRTVSLTSDDHHTVFQQSGARVYDLRP